MKDYTKQAEEWLKEKYFKDGSNYPSRPMDLSFRQNTNDLSDFATHIINTQVIEKIDELIEKQIWIERKSSDVGFATLHRVFKKELEQLKKQLSNEI